MNLAWHCRLVTRMINNNADCTIADYYTIVDKEEENEIADSVTQIQDSVESRSLALQNATEEEDRISKNLLRIQDKIREEERREKIRLRRKKKKFPKYKKSFIA
jgi:adenylyl- and sulfurtransferase ThiI